MLSIKVGQPAKHREGGSEWKVVQVGSIKITCQKWNAESKAWLKKKFRTQELRRVNKAG